MTAPRQEQRQSAPEYTTEDVERLAVFCDTECYLEWGWDPFRSADDDFQVLERARKVWSHSEMWNRFVVAYSRIHQPPVSSHSAALSVMLMYAKAGDYSRAVLAILKAMPEGEAT